MADSALTVFLIVFAVIGGTELIDRTNFALIGFAARHRPFPTWVGGAAAFLVTSALAVVVGAALVAALGGHVLYLRLGGGAFLLGYAAYLLVTPEEDRRAPPARSAALSAFLLILLLELGDTTMIFLIVFVSAFPNPPLIFAAGASALVLVAASASLIGSRLGARVEPKSLDRLVIVILVVVGTLTVIYALMPGLFGGLP
ncbi:MAG TPA: TMEM165/GDT1 family protein [Thermoplasmata archaeon]|nr:TMEM165/GDT1 family protein [Thermoplasmata archaeon]